MKKLISVVCVISLFLLFGCTSKSSETSPNSNIDHELGSGTMRVAWIESDNCKILCAKYAAGSGVGLTCDWDNKICEAD